MTTNEELETKVLVLAHAAQMLTLACERLLEIQVDLDRRVIAMELERTLAEIDQLPEVD